MAELIVASKCYRQVELGFAVGYSAGSDAAPALAIPPSGSSGVSTSVELLPPVSHTSVPGKYICAEATTSTDVHSVVKPYSTV